MFFEVQGLITRIHASVSATTAPHVKLLKIARSPLSLIRWGFERRAITCDGDTFRPASGGSLFLPAPFFSTSDLFFSVLVHKTCSSLRADCVPSRFGGTAVPPKPLYPSSICFFLF
jgi:hypothetical protein